MINYIMRGIFYSMGISLFLMKNPYSALIHILIIIN